MFILKMAKKREEYTFKTLHFYFFKKDCPHILSLKKLLDCVEILSEFSNFSTNFLGRVSIACCFYPYINKSIHKRPFKDFPVCVSPS